MLICFIVTPECFSGMQVPDNFSCLKIFVDKGLLSGYDLRSEIVHTCDALSVKSVEDFTMDCNGVVKFTVKLFIIF